jgi:Cu(I)/Ag(I) efflux system membrane protein CusA/SilA
MIARLIRWSIANRFLVLLATLGWWRGASGRCAHAGRCAARPVGRAGHHPHHLSGPGAADRREPGHLSADHHHAVGAGRAQTVRGYSFFGDSFVYVLFEDGTDPYWARSRVLEYLNQVQSRLPPQARPALGPDATGVGWVYEYALVDRSGKHDLSQLRALQDWFLKYELKTVPNVSEVASIGGMVRQYQIVLDPDKLRAYGITHGKVIDAVQKANQESGGSVLELGEAEYMVRASGYLRRSTTSARFR